MSPPGRPKGEYLSAQREGTPVSDAQALEVFDCEIGGTRLIEASAGTGKTWNICAACTCACCSKAITPYSRSSS